MSHPGRLPGGGTIDALVSGYDFGPTLLAYLDLPETDADSLPGRSFMPVLCGESDSERESVVVFAEYGPTRMLRTRQWKYVHRYAYGPHELYNLVHDADERHNLADEPEQAQRVREMRQELAEWFARYVDPMVDGARLPVTGAGQNQRIESTSCGENSFLTET
jgi:choline-sulfatase